MISRLLYMFQSGWSFVRQHRQIQFALLLIVVLPLAFWYTSDRFLEVGRQNESKLQRDRVGIMHDAFVSLLRATNYDAALVQSEITAITAINPDITKFRVVRQDGQQFIPIAALDATQIGEPEEVISLYQTAAVRFDESLIFPYAQGGVRYWQSVRAIQAENGAFYYILTENSFAVTDAYLAANERRAYVVLAFIYIIVLAIAYWQIRSIDYRQRFEVTQAQMEAKDMFTNMIAHELRAPLTAMRGYASMITESKDASSKHKEYAARIEESAERLVTIVSDLLDVARIQSGKLKVESTDVVLGEVVSKVTAELSPMAEDKDITLAATGDLTALGFVDEKRFHQILTNLISNAIKYTMQGGIEVALTETPGAVEIRIKDTGMGISAEDQKRLFAPFFRVESKEVNTITGTGLGMWITRQLIELMGATVGVESIKDVGTHIIVTIPKGGSQAD